MQTDPFSAFLSSLTSGFTSVVAPSISAEKYAPLDLTSSNRELDRVDITSSSAMEDYINQLLQKTNSEVAYGGYLEKRAIYQRSVHFNKQDPATERNIHLGVDLWIKAGTPVLAVLDGEIHSFKDNTAFGDYGPTIILKHHLNGITFFTLYGHLSRESLNGKKPGQPVKQGEAFATLGPAEVNGDYAPHLHFQVIKDLGTYNGDYPGVTSQKDLPYFKENCPDPNLLLKINP